MFATLGGNVPLQLQVGQICERKLVRPALYGMPARRCGTAVGSMWQLGRRFRVWASGDLWHIPPAPLPSPPSAKVAHGGNAPAASGKWFATAHAGHLNYVVAVSWETLLSTQLCQMQTAGQQYFVRIDMYLVQGVRHLNFRGVRAFCRER